MTYLNCDVLNCINNEKHLCARTAIRVDGCDASRKEQTCCMSYGDRGTSYENAVSENMSPTPETDITCDVRHCTYNTASACTAKNVKIGCDCHDVCNCRETTCTSFEAR